MMKTMPSAPSLISWLNYINRVCWNVGFDKEKLAVVDWYSRPSELTNELAGKSMTIFATEKSA
jgi:hypothetical protein